MKKINLLIILSAASFGMLIAQQKPSTKKLPPGENQPKNSNKNYPSLLWEISGNGLQKPSYLFGTMHISDKLAFHLGDSFYNAMRSVQTVALETNPGNWQDDFSKSVLFGNRRGFYGNDYLDEKDYPADNMRITSFAIDNYEEAIKAALAVEPSMINGMLYRTYGRSLDDFEEDTYLDMYIFQTGKKLGKKLTGVESFEESEKLILEAYRDMLKDRNKKKKSYDYEGTFANPKKMEDAYRKGDLDMLDSLDELNVTSDAFEEKFLYRRNDIQANSIDTILKRSSLFVAVGAAHLPGRRGVIELLRKKGYKLRPIKMDDRNSADKQMIEKIRAVVDFMPQTSEDGFYRVSIPGKKFYKFTDWTGMDIKQYADMVNGAYYVVTRVKTNSLFLGDPTELVSKRIDSFLYENIPGKILRKTAISRNGYKGWEIVNRTRRGDNQRYNIFITPFEILIFKMSGNGDYILKGNEAQQFFGSIKLKEYNETSWISYQPPTGGFSVQLPHSPSVLKDNNYGTDRLEYAAFDKKDGNSYLVMKANFHNYSFVEEDSFELNLMDESYGFSSFINKRLSHHFTTVDGYPSLDCKYLHKDGSYSAVKYVIRGPVYYSIAAHYNNQDENAKKFISSFSVKPFIYPEVRLRTDTSLHFRVQSPVFPDEDRAKEEMNRLIAVLRSEDDEDDNEFSGSYGLSLSDKTKFIGNDTIGEKILVTYSDPGKYLYLRDTTKFWKKIFDSQFDDDDSDFIFKSDKSYELQGGIKCRDILVTDTGSSRIILSKWLYKDGHLFTLTTLTDTLSTKSTFLDRFFATFAPSDSLKVESVFSRKSESFFNNFFSPDSATAKAARKSLYKIKFDSLDAPLLQNAIGRINWSTKNYLEVKKYFIGQLGNMKDSLVTAFLKDLYVKVKDSAEFQNAILNALLRQKTKTAFIGFKDLIVHEPPIFTEDGSDGDYSSVVVRRLLRGYRTSIPQVIQDVTYDGDRWSPLYDTLALTRLIFPDLLQLINLDDYKEDVLKLMKTMVDSGFLKGSDYDPYFQKFYIEAKQLLKKQMAKEDEDNIAKLARKNRTTYIDEDDEDEEMDQGNQDLEDYAVLLMPFYDQKSDARNFFDQLMRTRDKQLLYSISVLMIRNDKPLPDSLITSFAKQDEYRSQFYEDLKDMKKIDRFPATYKNQIDIARSLLVSDERNYAKPDSIVYIDKLPVAYKKKKGWVYFFKYKKERDDDYWQLAMVGMQPENVQEVDPANDDFTDPEAGKLENNKPLNEQLQQALHEKLCSMRTSASSFYQGRSGNIYKTYLSEMVKSRRYRD